MTPSVRTLQGSKIKSFKGSASLCPRGSNSRGFSNGAEMMIKRGSRVRVVKMDTAGGMDWQAKRLEGKVFTVRYIDSAGMIHLEETGIALIPGVDQYEVVM